MVMIIHRTNRDINRCRRKYGEAWKRYEKEVPYLFIPVSFKNRCSKWWEIADRFGVCDLVGVPTMQSGPRFFPFSVGELGKSFILPPPIHGCQFNDSDGF